MKKLFISLLILLTAFLGGCINRGQQVQLPDIIGQDINDSLLMIAGNFEVNEILEPTSQFLPGIVIGYRDYNVGDNIDSSEIINVIVASEPENSYSLNEQNIEYVTTIGYITGPNSLNFDLLKNAGVYGTDLGIPVDIGDQIMFLFGDTFSGDHMTGFWNSNFIALSSDEVFYDGLNFSDLVTRESGIVKPFAQGLHNSGNPDPSATTEVTKIPTGGILLGNYVYIFYMSVRYWGFAGQWLVSYNQVVKAPINDLTNFVEVEGLRWSENDAPNFGQIFPIDDPNSNYIYLVGIPGGRSGGVMLSRVLESNFENINDYEYYVNDHTWMSGQAGLDSLLNSPYYSSSVDFLGKSFPKLVI